MVKQKLLYPIAYCIFLVFAFCGCSTNLDEWKIVEAEKVVLYNEDQTTVLENKTEIEEFIDLLQVDSWQILNSNLSEGVNRILVAELYKNEEMIGQMDFFDDDIIQFKMGTATFNLEAKNDVERKILDAFIAE